MPLAGVPRGKAVTDPQAGDASSQGASWACPQANVKLTARLRSPATDQSLASLSGLVVVERGRTRHGHLGRVLVGHGVVVQRVRGRL